MQIKCVKLFTFFFFFLQDANSEIKPKQKMEELKFASRKDLMWCNTSINKVI